MKNIKITVVWPLLILLMATSFLTITPKNVLANVYGGSNYGSGSYGQLGGNANNSTTPATGSVSSTTTGTTSGSSPATSNQSSSSALTTPQSSSDTSDQSSVSTNDETTTTASSTAADDTKTKNNAWSKVWIWLLGAFIVFDIVFVILRFRRKRL